MTGAVTVLGIESSCDDTAAAVVRRDRSGTVRILASVVLGQDGLHDAYGGIVPEIAARAHAEKLDMAVEQALATARLDLADMDAIAVTAGPGLIGGVLSGVMCAKGLAAGSGKPLIGVNHLAGHALTPRMTDSARYPYLVLLASGGHCQFIAVAGPDAFRRLGGTIDDAPGEAFDKVARMLGLGFPGGPAIEDDARAGDPERFRFPRPLLDRDGMDMSFSGLKTAVLRARDRVLAETDDSLTLDDRHDLAACFQQAVAETLAEKSRRACLNFRSSLPERPSGMGRPLFAIAGGVAANGVVRTMLADVSTECGFRFVAPPPQYCTDNAAMIAWAGIELFAAGRRDELNLVARPRWPLDEDPPSGRKPGRPAARA
ncbi:MAG: tRNA (adenosine(37)-N6)-threonylcarbamoyltransferase complex transferase subunit TsaD [Paracoccaceae bacterium]|nr:tRNA (adenosine(37)-N6)-threonylcarbamoyltransferase complex transferase subunit TsaD [Paracoccaceae bacterium]